MDCYFVENVMDIMVGFFKDRGIYMLIFKGFYIFEWFVFKNGIIIDYFFKFFVM